MAFYAAVEFVECMLAARKRHSKSHDERNQALKRSFPSISADFPDLYNASTDGRYGSPPR